MAENDSAVFLANFNGHDPIIALPGLKHGDSVIRFFGVEYFLVNNAPLRQRRRHEIGDDPRGQPALSFS